jgi:transposase
VRHAHVHGARQCEGAQGREGVRHGPAQPRQEHDARRLDDARGRHGRSDGATDAAVFEAYVEGLLAPSLSARRIVLLDNLGAHKTERVRELIEARGAEVWFLPAYPPELNPIEEAFSKIKALLKRAAARTREALIEAMGEALGAVTPEDARGWFAHSGYAPRDPRL